MPLGNAPRPQSERGVTVETLKKNPMSVVEDHREAERYFSDAGLNASTIKACVASLNPIQIVIDRGVAQQSISTTSPAMVLGSAAHTMILEGAGVYKGLYAVEPSVDRRTKVGKSTLAAWLLDHGNKTAIKPEADILVRGMSEKVKGCAHAKQFLRNGKAEGAYYWIDGETGAKCKARLDYVQDGLVVDLKTCKDASISGFTSAVGNFRYHVQAAWYLRAYRECTGLEPKGFVFVAVESKPPHTVGVYELDADTLSAADEICGMALRLWARHTAGDKLETNYGPLQTIGLWPSALHNKNKESEANT